LLLNIHLPTTTGPSIELPTDANKLPDQHAKQLFHASSTLTPFMVARAIELGMPAADNSRGFIFNAQPLHIIHFLDIGTRPANVHLRDRKSTRLNSSHGSISYAVFCLKK